MFETRIVRQADRYFIEHRYAGPVTFDAILFGRWPRLWERHWNCSCASLGEARQWQSQADMQLARQSTPEVVG